MRNIWGHHLEMFAEKIHDTKPIPDYKERILRWTTTIHHKSKKVNIEPFKASP